MKFTSVSILIGTILILTGCGEKDDGNLFLSCKGTQSVYMNKNGRDLGTETKQTNYSFEFTNKKLKEIDCQTWSSDEIKCNKVLTNGGYKKTTNISINRKTGTFAVSEISVNDEPNNQSVIEDRGEGSCEKIVKNKL